VKDQVNIFITQAPIRQLLQIMKKYLKQMLFRQKVIALSQAKRDREELLSQS
jgi:hypothetical protein